MPERHQPIHLAEMSLAAVAEALVEHRLPPVEEWQPAHCGHSDMRIARDGTWYHGGSPIRRPAMVRLFSTILRREPDGSHVLVTPVEKLTIQVDLAAFVVTAMSTEGTGTQRRIALQLNNGDAVILGPQHTIRLHSEGIPLVTVRAGLEASLARPVYYELAELALGERPDKPGLWSNGTFFSLVSA